MAEEEDSMQHPARSPPSKVARPTLPTERSDVLDAIRNLQYETVSLAHSHDYWCEREFVLEAVALDGGTLEFASPRLRGNRDIVHTALRTGKLSCRARGGGPALLHHASADLRNDKETVLLAVAKTGANFPYASEALRDDRDVVWTAVRKGNLGLFDTPVAFRGDREIVLQAVTERGWYLQWAAQELREDREIVLAAALNNTAALAFAPIAIRSDKDFAMEIVARDGFALHFLTDGLSQDKEVVLKAVKHGRLRLSNGAIDDFFDDRDIVLAAVSNNGDELRFASHALRSDKEVVLAAATNNIGAFEHALNTDKMFNDLNFIASLMHCIPEQAFSHGVSTLYETKLRCFPGLANDLEKVVSRLLDAVYPWNACGSMSTITPELFEGIWLDQLVTAQLCFSKVLPPETSRHIAKFYGMNEQYNCILHFRKYKTVIAALMAPNFPWIWQARDFIRWCISTRTRHASATPWNYNSTARNFDTATNGLAALYESNLSQNVNDGRRCYGTSSSSNKSSSLTTSLPPDRLLQAMIAIVSLHTPNTPNFRH